jgi:hypothetical protein
MTINERDALIEILHTLVRIAFRHSVDAEKVELLAQWRESYEVLCAGACSVDSPEAR